MAGISMAGEKIGHLSIVNLFFCFILCMTKTIGANNMNEKQYEQIMTLLKDIKKRIMLLSIAVGISLGLFLSVLLQKI
jgi:hypothetical protein